MRSVGGLGPHGRKGQLCLSRPAGGLRGDYQLSVLLSGDHTHTDSEDRQGRWERAMLSTGHRPRANQVFIPTLTCNTHPHPRPCSLGRKVFSVQFMEKMRLPGVKQIAPCSQHLRFKLTLGESKHLWGEGSCIDMNLLGTPVHVAGRWDIILNVKAQGDIRRLSGLSLFLSLSFLVLSIARGMCHPGGHCTRLCL